MDRILARFQLVMAECDQNYLLRRYCLAISGGVDSMALLEVASQCFAPASLVIAHFDHGVRDGSQADCEFLAEQAKLRGIQFLSERHPAVWTGRPSEAMLRNLRLRFLRKARISTRCDYLVTAHHLNDQIETLFMRLMRGTGAHGLAGIAVKQGRTLHPLLGFTKGELVAYALAKQLAWREDETNASQEYLRNQVREALVPLFLKLAGPFGDEAQVLRRIGQTAIEVRGLSQREARRVQSRLSRTLVTTPFWFRLAASDWKQLTTHHDPQSLIAGILKKMGLARTTRPVLSRILQAMSAGKRNIPLPENARARFSLGYWFFETAQQQSANLRAAQEDIATIKFNQPTWKVRFFRAGDRLGRSKLKKLFLENRIPLPERSLIPIVTDASDNVLWFYTCRSRPPALDSVNCHFPFSFNTLT